MLRRKLRARRPAGSLFPFLARTRPALRGPVLIVIVPLLMSTRGERFFRSRCARGAEKRDVDALDACVGYSPAVVAASSTTAAAEDESQRESTNPSWKMNANAHRSLSKRPEGAFAFRLHKPATLQEGRSLSALTRVAPGLALSRERSYQIFD